MKILSFVVGQFGSLVLWYEILIIFIWMKSLVIVLLLMLAPAFGEVFSLSRDYEISTVISSQEIGHAYFENQDRKTGWNRFYGYANPNVDPIDQHRAIGFLQGYATYTQIHSAYLNFVQLDFNGSAYAPASVQTFLDDQIEYIDLMVSKNPTDVFWQYTQYYLQQVRYMHVGYMTRVRKEKRSQWELDFKRFLYLTSVGDLEDVLELENQKGEQNLRKNCNGYVRLLDGQVYVTHGTHNRYSFLLRIFKTWSFPRAGVPMQTTSFTSRPGDLISKDDFFLLSSGLRVLQTSLGNMNPDNLKEMRPTTVPSWLRTLVANHLAHDNLQWIEYFTKERSGTHNNQWVLINPKNVASRKNVIHFHEEAFSLFATIDMTDTFFKDGYIGSYNVPITESLFDKLGYKQPTDKHYWQDLRGIILKNLHPKLTNEEEMKYWLIMNEESDPKKGLAPRYDMADEGRKAFGMTDCKVASPETVAQNYFWAISGPPQSNGRFPPFDWDNWNLTTPHVGLPTTFNFTWQKIPIDIERQLKSTQ